MRVLFWQAAVEGPTFVDAQSVALGLATISADPTVALYLTSSAQAVATVFGEPVVAKYQVSTAEAVATVTGDPTLAKYQISTAEGVATIADDPTVAKFLESIALGEATITAIGEAYTEALPARVVSGGMVGIPRNPPWDWHRKPKQEDEDEEELVAAGVEKSGIDPLLVMILAMEDD